MHMTSPLPRCRKIKTGKTKAKTKTVNLILCCKSFILVNSMFSFEKFISGPYPEIFDTGTLVWAPKL